MEIVSTNAASLVDDSGFEQSKKQIMSQKFPRAELSGILYRYNRDLGNDALALHNCSRLQKEGEVCVVTGQQLGFMGGPAYTILKGISCLRLAKEKGAIPLFWLATEDHDLDEIAHTFLLDACGNLKKYRIALQKEGRMVEDLQMAGSHYQTARNFLEAVGRQELYEKAAKENSYARFMTRLIMQLFAGTGLVFVEPYLLRSLSRSFFIKEIEEADEIFSLLQTTSGQLKSAGITPQIAIERGTNLFFKVKGEFRTKIKREDGAYFIGKKPYTREQLVALVEKKPELFSVNVAARPVLQSILFPTAAYVAGPAEFAYFHQLKSVFRFHGTSMPWVVPRMSMTFIPPKAQHMLHLLHLEPWGKIPERLTEALPNLKGGIAEAKERVEKILQEYFGKAAIGRFVQKSMRQMEKQVVSRRLESLEISPYFLHYLRNLLHPRQKRQERILNWWEFQSQTEDQLVLQLVNAPDLDPHSFHYCFL